MEGLESRVLLSASQTIAPDFRVYKPVGAAKPMAATGSPTGTTPATMRHAYTVDQIMFGALPGDGTGQTIAIVDAFNLPTATTDLAAFDTQYGLAAPPSFKIINQTGGTSLPAADVVGGWGVEIALDIEWAHVMAPNANIVLVEATNSSDTNLYKAVDTARNLAGVSVVSMSWGGDETSTDSSNDSHFLTPTGHIGVTFFSSSGDNGAYSDNQPSSTKIVGYPAVSPNVVAVGGTTLTTGAGGVWSTETGWGNGTTSNSKGGSGGGISKFFAMPTWQNGIDTVSGTFRGVPDVSFDADPNTGVPVYDVYDDGSSTPWLQVGGTSLASPMWGGLMAVIDQGRVNNGLSTLDGSTQTLPMLYALPSTDFHDITSGNNGYAASSGYDLVTGRGSPIATLLVADMIGTPQTPTPTIGAFTVSPTPIPVGAASVTLTASGVAETGGTVSAVNFYLESNSSSGLQIGSDTLVGSGTVSGTTWTIATATSSLAVGSYTYYAVATDTSAVSGATASATLAVNPISAGGAVTFAWNVTGQTGFGTQGLAATTVDPSGSNTLGLTRGSGVTTNPTAASNAWGGNGFAATSAAGISGNKFVEFGFTVNSDYALSLTAMDMNYRRSSSAPSNGYWQYQINGGAWTLIGDVTSQFSSTSSSGAAMAEMSLAGIAALQNLAAGTVVDIRVIPYGGSGGNWYVYDKTGNDLVLRANATFVAPPPTITGVYVDSSSWSPAYVNSLVAAGMGSATLGYEMPTGAGQLLALPQNSIDTVTLQFSEGVTVTQGMLTVSGISVGSYSIVGFSYDSAAHTATWTLGQPVAADTLTLDLSANVTDSFGIHLDGEWSNGVSSVSGNGTAGGNFVYQVNVLPGDINGDGTVNFADFVLISNNFGSTTAPAEDLNGDGTVNFADFVILSNSFGTQSPTAAEVATADAIPAASAAASAPMAAAPPSAATVVPAAAIPAVMVSVPVNSPISIVVAPPSGPVVAVSPQLPSMPVVIAIAQVPPIHRSVHPTAKRGWGLSHVPGKKVTPQLVVE